MEPNDLSYPILYKKLAIPHELTQEANIENKILRYGGDIRIGDLTNNGQVDFLVYRSTNEGMVPCFLAALDIHGNVLWKTGSGGSQPARPGAVAIHDIDGDSQTEVITFFAEPNDPIEPNRMVNVRIRILEGRTGAIKLEKIPIVFKHITGSGANWVHQRILIANLRGLSHPQDFIIKLGDTICAFDNTLSVLWTYTIKWNEYSYCSAYIPTVGDIDGDGHDEVNGGYFLLDHDGSPMWENQLARNMDSVAIAPWDNGTMRALCSGGGYILSETGEVILRLGEEIVPHGQEMRCANFLADSNDPALVIRYNGHTPQVITVDNQGQIRYRFRLNESPNNTGMEVVYWRGYNQPAVLYNGGVLWNADGTVLTELPDLPLEQGPPRMGWYHCIPANICGDEREEVIVYNPWDRFIFIYTPNGGQINTNSLELTEYQPGPRQYNVRLMD